VGGSELGQSAGLRPPARARSPTASALLALLLTAGAQASAAEEPPPAAGDGAADGPAIGSLQARGRLQLRTALALRHDTVTRPERSIRARGQAPSQLVLDGLWLSEGYPIGVAAHLDGQRFSLRGEDPVTGPFDSVATALEGSAGLLARRLALHGRLSLEGQVGYALARIPIAEVPADSPGGAMPVAASAFSGHGPVASARIAFAAMDALALETSARVRPVAFGARLDGKALSVRAASAGAAVLVGAFAGKGLRLSGLIGYELSWLDASAAGGLQVHQLQHGIGIGLVAGLLLPPPPPPPQPVVVVPKPPEPVRGLVRGVVRAAHASAAGPVGAPLPGVTVSVDAGPTTTTDANGAFVLKGLGPGMTTVHLSGAGLLPDEEVLVIPADGEVSVEVSLRPVESARLAVITGLVRSEDGPAVAARVSVVELDLTSQADARGRFRLEVPAGRYTVVIEAPGLQTQRKTLTVAAGEHSIYNLDLQRER